MKITRKSWNSGLNIGNVDVQAHCLPYTLPELVMKWGAPNVRFLRFHKIKKHGSFSLNSDVNLPTF